MAIQISPSILSADFANLGADCERVAGTADWLHVDVMDNHFVPNLTLGLPVVQALLATVTTPIDCHLMIEDPDRWAPAFAEAGAGSVTFHIEAAHAPVRLAREIRNQGARSAMGLKPATGIDQYADILEEFDMILLMTVEPGFGGQSFLDMVVPKIRRTRELLGPESGIWLQVDGGIDLDSASIVAEAGANVLVAGSAVYGADDPAAAIEKIRAAATNAISAP